jgi:hypothetical protein
LQKPVLHEQLTVHAPQCSGSLLRSTQVPLQQVCPSEHEVQVCDAAGTIALSSGTDTLDAVARVSASDAPHDAAALARNSTDAHRQVRIAVVIGKTSTLSLPTCE